VQETAYAKINLALHVRERRADGYHALETLFAFAEAGDRLTAEESSIISLGITGSYADYLSTEDNLVTRATHAFINSFSIKDGIALHQEINLPVASGVGGGSADAAAALRLLARQHNVPLDEPRLTAIAAGLGADVPACLASIAVRGEGRGDVLSALPQSDLANMPLLLVNPRLPLATGDVFRGWDRVDRGPLPVGDPLAVARAGRNDLETPARRLLPVIGDLLELLARQPGAALVRMSGSGATCFALFDDDAARDAADRAIATAVPAWWRLATRLR
jgi:4-diphosphocytidyl-2-C-methyl-D-erythritol kinase